MSKYFKITILVILLLLPLAVSARGLVPCGGEGEPQCNLCHVFQLMQNLTKGASIAILGWAALFIVIGGVLILTSGGSPDKASQGKRMITYAIIGVVICFSAWIIINTVMNALAKQPGQPGAIPWPWNRIECAPTEPVVPSPTAEKNYCACQEPLTTRGSYTLVKATALKDATTCNQECVFNNRSTYCNIAATSPNSMKCLSASELNSTEARCLKRAYTYERIGQTCYSTDLECANSISIYSRCDDADCQCYDSDDLSGVTFPCQTNQFAIFEKTEDMSKYDIGFCGNVLTCQQQLEPSGNNCWWCASGSTGCEKTNGSEITVGTCKGVNCSDAGLNICGSTSNNCSTSQVNSWNTQIQAAASGRTICGGVNTIKMVKAIMARESGGVISRIATDGQSAGLMQLTPATANRLKNACGVSENIDFNWLTNSANAEAQICIAIEFLKSLVGACGCDVRQLAAGYNGGGGKTGACDQSTNCGPAASADGGECLICSGKSFTRRWECLWDDNKHTICNADRAAGSFEATRRYVPQVAFCYSQF